MVVACTRTSVGFGAVEALLRVATRLSSIPIHRSGRHLVAAMMSRHVSAVDDI